MISFFKNKEKNESQDNSYFKIAALLIHAAKIDEAYEEKEEDIIKETPPKTADAMKRYKAGKAGFTDKAHLKAKGLIPRSDGKKKVSDKYK